MPDFETEMMIAVKEGLRLAVKDKMSGYHSPLDKLLTNIIDSQTSEMRTLLLESITSALTNADFRDEIKTAIRHKLARVLIERFGGELEKQVNTLKSDPATRARIVLAIEEIIKAK